MYVAANAVLMLLSLFILGMSLTLYHLNARQHSFALGVLTVVCTSLTVWLCWLPANAWEGSIVRLCWLTMTVGGAALLWWPVVRSPLRRQKQDETAWLATIWLMVPMFLLQTVMVSRLSGLALGLTGSIYVAFGFLSVGIFSYGRFIRPAMWRKHYRMMEHGKELSEE
ncbi:hypothetical protein PaecuDRAFT_4705 [Paenibacillus curdlanolyticus YK9]|uniref:Uncharacterized protein n=2 Tax=Paenibacillus curdlanolyticus TaxID=59840 RepID=E0IGB2_9BACL|nr:hypothetical protein PaecuDRAFT_4705 [Paenibacillus curdlanolyticus YK9]